MIYLLPESWRTGEVIYFLLTSWNKWCNIFLQLVWIIHLKNKDINNCFWSAWLMYSYLLNWFWVWSWLKYVFKSFWVLHGYFRCHCLNKWMFIVCYLHLNCLWQPRSYSTINEAWNMLTVVLKINEHINI